MITLPCVKNGKSSVFCRPYFLLFIVFFGVSSAYSEDQIGKVITTPLKIGVTLPLSGQFSMIGTKLQKALTDYQTNSVSLLFEDDQCLPAEAVRAYKKLSFIDGIKLFVGPLCGSPQSTIAPLLKNDAGLALLGSAAPASAYEASGKRMFSAQPTIEAESMFLAKELNRRGIKTLAIVFKENQFSRAYEAAFRKTFTGNVVATIPYGADSTELKSVCLKLRKLSPEALFVPDVSTILDGLMKGLFLSGQKNKPVFAVWSTQLDSVIPIANPYITDNQLIYSYPDIGDNEAISYFPRIALELLLTAAKNCGNNVECIKKNLIQNNAFDENGSLQTPFILKTIKDSRFIRVIDIVN